MRLTGLRKRIGPPCRQAAKLKGLQIGFDGNAIQCDRLLQGFGTDRNASELPCITEHHHIGQNRVAEMLSGQCVSIKSVHLFWSQLISVKPGYFVHIMYSVYLLCEL